MRVLTAADGPVLGLGFGPAADALAAAVKDRGVFLWPLASTSPVAIRIDRFDPPKFCSPVFAPDGRSVSWLGRYGPRTYDRDARALTEIGLDAAGNLCALCRFTAGDRIVTQHTYPESALIGWRPADDGWEREWSVSTRRFMAFLPTLSPDGGRVAMLTREVKSTQFHGPHARLELRSAVSGTVTATADYPAYSQEPEALVFSPDGAQLVAVHKATLLVWPVPKLGEPRAVRNDTRKHFTAVAYHPSGRYLFAASRDTTVHVFETATWERVARFSWNVGPLRSVAVSPDGTLAAAGGHTGEVVVWDLDV